MLIQRFVAASMVSLLLAFAPGMAVGIDESGEPQSRLFDSRPEHPWNCLHAALWLRQAADGKTYGDDRLDPLLWNDTQHLTSGDSARRMIERLDAFLGESNPALKDEALKRAILQRDLWAVFDWLANRELSESVSADKTDRNLRRDIRQKLAMAMQRLALDENQIASLPDNYQAAVAAQQFPTSFDPQRPQQPFLPPRLFDKSGPWVGLGTSDGPVAPAHVRGDAGLSRSAITIFLRLPGGRKATLAYLKQLAAFKTPWVEGADSRGVASMIPNPATPQFPAGTQVALVRRALLVDTEGRLTPTALTEQVQFRVYNRIEEMQRSRPPAADPAQRFFEFVLSRERLFGGRNGGLRAVDFEERDFFPIPFSSGIDAVEHHAGLWPDRRKSLSMSMSVTLQTCVGCHHEPGVLSVNAYSRNFSPRTLRRPTFFATGTERADQMAGLTKKRRFDWGLLSGISSQFEPIDVGRGESRPRKPAQD